MSKQGIAFCTPLFCFYPGQHTSFSVCASYLCVCCIAIPSILDVRVVDAPAGVTQEEGYTGFLHLSSAVLASIFIAIIIQPSVSLVDREVEFCA